MSKEVMAALILAGGGVAAAIFAGVIPWFEPTPDDPVSIARETPNPVLTPPSGPPDSTGDGTETTRQPEPRTVPPDSTGDGTETTRQPEPRTVRYRVTTKTSDLPRAGTCEQIRIRLIGTDRSSEDHRLDNEDINDFQRDASDVFEFDDKDIGDLTGFRLDMSNATSGCSGDDYNDIHIEWVRIENLTDDRSTEENIDAWLGNYDDARLFLERNVKY